MSKKVIIIGGGIIGLCSAYFLQKEGHEVTILDKSDISSGASFVNAGFITPSHIVPLASPGMITKGIKWMFNPSSPFYIKPRWDKDFFKWAWYFYRASTKKKVEKAIPIIKDINIISRELFQEIHNSQDLGIFQLERKGLLMMYKTEKEWDHEMEVVANARFLGLEVDALDLEGLKRMEPHIPMNVKGAIHYKCDAHMSPNQFMDKMLAYLKFKGIEVNTGEEVLDISISGNRISGVITNINSYNADEVVLSAGSWSQLLSKKMGIDLPLQAGKGYSINVARPTGLTIPAILLEAKVAVTPMANFTRFAGTMEFSGINTKINRKRTEAVARAVKDYYPNIEISEEEISQAKSGLRPVSPDGLPYIGRTTKFNNLIFATGHAMMGWSLGPITGKLVCQIVSDIKPSMDISPFSPNRKF